MSAVLQRRNGEAADLGLRAAGFNLLPASYLHPDRMAELLPAGLSAPLRQELLACRRLRHRLSQRILKAFCSQACNASVFEAEERRIALRGRDGIGRLVRLAGAAWHGGFLRTVVSGGALREVIDCLGQDARDFALSHLDLSAPLRAEIALEDLRLSVDRDGIGCLKAWSVEQPQGLRERLALMLSPADWGDGAPEPRHQAKGPAIVREAALEVLRHD